MTSPTTERGLIGHFLRGADPLLFDQRASPPPVQLQKYFSLKAILAVGTRGGVGAGSVRADARAQGMG